MLIVDVGPLVAYLNRNDPDHDRCAALLEPHQGDLVVTPYVLADACYLAGRYGGPRAAANLLEAVAEGELVQAGPDGDDLARIAQLLRTYQRVPLGLTDASVVALAERYRAMTVATLDHRRFRVVKPRHTPALTLVP